MTVWSAVHAVTTSSFGTDDRSTISEWYRVASNGSDTPAITPELSWRIHEVLPCDGSFRTTFAPKASPRHWWPRQTPRMTTLPLSSLMVFVETPASSGVPGPGEMTVSYTHLRAH